MANNQQLPLFDTVNNAQLNKVNSTEYSDYIVYVDESGDHSLEHVDVQYPVFVLAFTIFHKRHYAEKIVPAVEKFKFNHFGHDLVILHEHEIRKQKNAFKILVDRTHRKRFMDDLSDIMAYSNFILVSCVIDKQRLKLTDNKEHNPYHLALNDCLEGLYNFLEEKQQLDRKTHVLVECRGKKEDKELELAFRRMCDGNNPMKANLPFDVVFVDKKANSTGLQLADLVARPIGINYLRPQ